MNNKDKYRRFCEAAPDLPLFLQPWYLDAVCEGGQWDAGIFEENGQVVAVMPWFLKRKWHYRYVAMPVLGKFMGPYILPARRGQHREMKYYEGLIAQLPQGLAAFEQDMHYGVANWLPFYWRGFRQTTRYSYTLDLTLSEAAIWQDVSANYRAKIRKATTGLTLVKTADIAAVYRLCALSFARQNATPPYSGAFIAKIFEALRAHGAVQCFLAVDEQERIHSAAMLVWDKTAAYYLLSGDDPALRASGSAVFLKWEAIKFAKNDIQAPIFDFEGSMIQRIERNRREFGAMQKPYFRIWREWSWIWRLLKTYRRR